MARHPWAEILGSFQGKRELIRIEDDAIVTEGGCELITRGVPVKADEIEALMRA